MNLDTHGELRERMQTAVWQENYAAIPGPIIDGLIRFVLHGVETGGFLAAVLRNDFQDAIARADPDSLAAIREIAVFVHQELPARCHGSRANVVAWRKMMDTYRREAVAEDGGYEDRDAPANAVKGDLP